MGTINSFPISTVSPNSLALLTDDPDYYVAVKGSRMYRTAFNGVAQAEAAADRAEAAAAVLEGFAEPDPFSGTTVYGQADYALPYDPGAEAYVQLYLGGAHQVAGTDFTLHRSGGVTYIRFTDLGNADGVEFHGFLQRPLQYDPNVPVFTLEQLGVVAGEDADDQGPAFIAALATAAGRPIRGTPGAIYRVDTAIDHTGDVRLDMSASKALVGANVRAFRFSAPVAGPYALTADYVVGSTTLAVATMDAVPSPGDVIWIASEARDPGNRDNGSSSQQYRCGEMAVVGVGSTTTSVVLASPLTMVEGISPTSTSGDEARIPSYTVAMRAQIAVPDMDAVCDVSLPNGGAEDGHDGDGWNAALASFRGYVRPKIRIGALDRGYGPAVQLFGTAWAEVSGGPVRNLTDNPSSQLGYGVADAGYGTRVVGLATARLRHAYTTVKTSSAFSEPVDPYTILAVGRCVGGAVDGAHGVGGNAAIFSTHADAEGTTFLNCVAMGGNSWAFNNRGRCVSVVSPVILDCFAGIGLFTEYDSGDTDDDIYNNGKLTNDFSSGTVTSPIMRVTERCFDVRASTLSVGGIGNYRAKAGCLIYVSGGALIFSGDHHFTLSGNTVASLGVALIDVSGTNAYSTAAFPVSETVIEGTAIIDATGWTGSPLTAVSAVSAKLTVRGLLRLLLSSGSTLFAGGTDNIVCEGGGRIEYSIAGSSGIVTGLSSRPIYLVDLASGEVMDGTARGKVWSGYSQVTDHTASSLIIRHGGGNVSGLRLRNTDTAVSDGEGAGSITFETNDTSNPAMDAFRILAQGSGSAGKVKLALQRNDAAGLLTALRIGNNGDVDFLRDDGTTVGATWDASTGLVLQGGAPLSITPEAFGVIGANATANSTVIAAFLSYLQSTGVHGVMRGIYRINTDFLVTGRISLDAAGARIVQTNGNAGFIQLRNGAEGSEVRNLRVEADLPSAVTYTTRYRGYNAGQRHCAVWVECGGVTVENITAVGMINAVCWRGPVVRNPAGVGYTGADTDPNTAYFYAGYWAENNRGSEIHSTGCDFAMTGHQQKNLQVRGYSARDVTMKMGVPPHAVYMTSDGGNCIGGHIDSGACYNSPDGAAHKFFDFIGASFSNMSAYDTSGVCNFVDCLNCTWSNLAGSEISGDNTQDRYAHNFTGCSGVIFGASVVGADDNAMGLIEVTDGTAASDLTLIGAYADVDWLTATGVSEALIRAAGASVLRVRALDARNRGDATGDLIRTADTATVTVSDMTTRGLWSGVNAAGGAIHLNVDPVEIEGWPLTTTGTVTTSLTQRKLEFDYGSSIALYGTTTAGTPTYSVRRCFVERVGPRVTLSIRIEVSGAFGGTGQVRIGPLPYAISNATGVPAVDIRQLITTASNITLTAGDLLVAALIDGESYIRLQTLTGLTRTALAHTAVGSGAIIETVVSYYTTDAF